MPERDFANKSQDYFWTKQWQESEREASEDIKAGRVKTFDSVDALFEELKSTSPKK